MPTSPSCSTLRGLPTGRSHGQGSQPSSPCAPSPAYDAERHSGYRGGDMDFLARTLRVKRQIQRPRPRTSRQARISSKRSPGPPRSSGHRSTSPSEPSTFPTRWSGFSPSTSASTRRPANRHGGCSTSGKPWHDNLVDYRWRSTRTDAGVTFKLHELRHDDSQPVRAPVAQRRGQDPCGRLRHGLRCTRDSGRRQAFTPVAGLALLVCQRHHDKFGCLNEIDESVREASHSTRPHHRDAVPTGPDRTRLRPFEDRVDDLIHEHLETITQPSDTFLVPRDVSTKLGNGLRVVTDVERQRCLAARSAAS